jgi:mannosyltransferase
MTQPNAPSGTRGLADSVEIPPGSPDAPVEPTRRSWAGLSWTAWAVGALTLLAAALRLSTLGEQSYWYNEAATVVAVKASFGDMISRVSHVEGNPPLYYVLAWLWAKLFGTGEVALRTLSALAGTAMVPAAYAATRRLVGSRPAVVVAALTACSPLLVWFSQEARPYALFALLATLTLLCFARVLEQPSPRRLALWAVVCALAVATHYFSIFVVGPEAIWLLVTLGAPRRVLAALALPVAAGLALLPIATNVSEQARTSIPGSFGERVVQVPKQFLVGFGLYSTGERAIVVAAGLLVVLGAAFALWRGDARERRGVLVAGTLGVAGVAAVCLLAAVGLDYLNTRNMIGLWLPFAIVAGCGFGARAAGRWGLAAAAALSAISVGAVIAVDVHRPYQRDDWRGAVRALGPAVVPRAIVATPSSATLPLEVYLPRAKVVRAPAVTVQEIDVLGIALRSSPGHEPQPPPPVSGLVPPGFVPIAVRRDRMFTVVRYRAAAPMTLPTGLVAGTRLSPIEPAVELEP